MKAVLVIDEMPNNCEECPCCYGFICSPLVREMGMWAIKNGKPTDCPLKPMPQKKEHSEIFTLNLLNMGYNACIEVLEK